MGGGGKAATLPARKATRGRLRLLVRPRAAHRKQPARAPKRQKQAAEVGQPLEGSRLFVLQPL